MSQSNQNQFNAEIEEEKLEDNAEKINIRLSVFFDGTLNNRTNINQRLVSSKEEELDSDERKAADELKEKMTPAQIAKAKGIYKKHQGGDNSYENGFTNIVKLERHVDTSSPPKSYQLMLKTYIDGSGTIEYKKDKVLGYGLGVFKSGVKAKVKKGLADVTLEIRKSHYDKEISIERLTLDVFGFSRGATAARHFIYKALLTDKAVKKALKANGYKVGKVDVCFAGLYDTVSSHGLSFSNDTAALNLDAVVHAKQVVHLTAADEHRENFSLTTIESAQSSGIEIYLPGVHSDVGGSYREGGSENHDIFWTMGANGLEEAKTQKSDLCRAGWYKENELTIIESKRRPGGKHTLKEVILHAQRDNISNEYSRIPLHIMAKFTRENEVKINSELELDEKISNDLVKVKSKIEEYINKHKNKGAYTSKPEDWLDNSSEWLKKLRYEYFHFSARLERGNGPRYINNKRGREYLYG